MDSHTGTPAPGLPPVTVFASGELDLATAPHLRKRLQQRTDPFGELVVDLSAVTFMDCSGARPLLEARIAIGRRLCLRSVPPPVTRLLTLAGLLPHFRYADSPTEQR